MIRASELDQTKSAGGILLLGHVRVQLLRLFVLTQFRTESRFTLFLELFLIVDGREFS